MQTTIIYPDKTEGIVTITHKLLNESNNNIYGLYSEFSFVFNPDIEDEIMKVRIAHVLINNMQSIASFKGSSITIPSDE